MNPDILTIKAAMLYIIKQLGEIDRQKLCKILYFSEQKSLVQCGTSIFFDNFLAKEFGPVPETAYSMMEKEPFIQKGKYRIITNEEPDMDNLSMDNVECIDQTIKENSKHSFNKLIEKSQDLAWDEAVQRFPCVMDYIKIAEAGGATEAEIHELKEYFESKEFFII